MPNFRSDLSTCRFAMRCWSASGPASLDPADSFPVRWTFTENSASAWGRCGKRWVFSNRHNSSCEPGRGTFVRGRETDRAYERFNPIRGNDGGPLRGRIKTGKAKLGTPRAWERAALTLEAGDQGQQNGACNDRVAAPDLL